MHLHSKCISFLVLCLFAVEVAVQPCGWAAPGQTGLPATLSAVCDVDDTQQSIAQGVQDGVAGSGSARMFATALLLPLFSSVAVPSDVTVNSPALFETRPAFSTTTIRENNDPSTGNASRFNPKGYIAYDFTAFIPADHPKLPTLDGMKDEDPDFVAELTLAFKKIGPKADRRIGKALLLLLDHANPKIRTIAAVKILDLIQLFILNEINEPPLISTMDLDDQHRCLQMIERLAIMMSLDDKSVNISGGKAVVTVIACIEKTSLIAEVWGSLAEVVLASPTMPDGSNVENIFSAVHLELGENCEDAGQRVNEAQVRRIGEFLARFSSIEPAASLYAFESLLVACEYSKVLLPVEVEKAYADLIIKSFAKMQDWQCSPLLERIWFCAEHAAIWSSSETASPILAMFARFMNEHSSPFSLHVGLRGIAHIVESDADVKADVYAEALRVIAEYLADDLRSDIVRRDHYRGVLNVFTRNGEQFLQAVRAHPVHAGDPVSYRAMVGTLIDDINVMTMPIDELVKDNAMFARVSRCFNDGIFSNTDVTVSDGEMMARLGTIVSALRVDPVRRTELVTWILSRYNDPRTSDQIAILMVDNIGQELTEEADFVRVKQIVTDETRRIALESIFLVGELVRNNDLQDWERFWAFLYRVPLEKLRASITDVQREAEGPVRDERFIKTMLRIITELGYRGTDLAYIGTDTAYQHAYALEMAMRKLERHATSDRPLYVIAADVMQSIEQESVAGSVPLTRVKRAWEYGYLAAYVIDEALAAGDVKFLRRCFQVDAGGVTVPDAVVSEVMRGLSVRYQNIQAGTLWPGAIIDIVRQPSFLRRLQEGVDITTLVSLAFTIDDNLLGSNAIVNDVTVDRTLNVLLDAAVNKQAMPLIGKKTQILMFCHRQFSGNQVANSLKRITPHVLEGDLLSDAFIRTVDPALVAEEKDECDFVLWLNTHGTVTSGTDGAKYGVLMSNDSKTGNLTPELFAERIVAISRLIGKDRSWAVVLDNCFAGVDIDKVRRILSEKYRDECASLRVLLAFGAETAVGYASVMERSLAAMMDEQATPPSVLTLGNFYAMEKYMKTAPAIGGFSRENWEDLVVYVRLQDGSYEKQIVDALRRDLASEGRNQYLPHIVEPTYRKMFSQGENASSSYVTTRMGKRGNLLTVPSPDSDAIEMAVYDDSGYLLGAVPLTKVTDDIRVMGFFKRKLRDMITEEWLSNGYWHFGKYVRQLVETQVPALYSFSSLLTDSYGCVARDKNGRYFVGIHESLVPFRARSDAELDPVRCVAFLHELLEYWIATGKIVYKLSPANKELVLFSDTDVELLRIDLAKENVRGLVAKAQQKKFEQHYVIRIVQRALFGHTDSVLTDYLKLMKIGNSVFDGKLPDAVAAAIDVYGAQVAHYGSDPRVRSLENRILSFFDRASADDVEHVRRFLQKKWQAKNSISARTLFWILRYIEICCTESVVVSEKDLLASA